MLMDWMWVVRKGKEPPRFAAWGIREVGEVASFRAMGKMVVGTSSLEENTPT